MQQSQPVALKRTWIVDVIDEQGTKNTKSLTVNDVWSLSPIEGLLWNGMMMTQRLKIGALSNRFLGHFARDYDVFLIGYTNWKKILKDYKQDVHNNIIQVMYVPVNFIIVFLCQCKY
ncbi:hypothetical protein AAZV13_13G155400 [Glycine max]